MSESGLVKTLLAQIFPCIFAFARNMFLQPRPRDLFPLKFKSNEFKRQCEKKP